MLTGLNCRVAVAAAIDIEALISRLNTLETSVAEAVSEDEEEDGGLDITELREAQQKLSDSEEHFRQLIELWPDQVMLSVNLDTNRHVYVSPSMELVMGYAPQEFYDNPGLGLRVVAEGVETAEQLEFLRGLQCEEFQGYLFSKPVPAEEAVKCFSGYRG